MSRGYHVLRAEADREAVEVEVVGDFVPLEVVLLAVFREVVLHHAELGEPRETHDLVVLAFDRQVCVSVEQLFELSSVVAVWFDVFHDHEELPALEELDCFAVVGRAYDVDVVEQRSDETELLLEEEAEVEDRRFELDSVVQVERVCRHVLRGLLASRETTR